MCDFLADVLQLRIKIWSIEHTQKFAVLVLLWGKKLSHLDAGHFMALDPHMGPKYKAAWCSHVTSEATITTYTYLFVLTKCLSSVSRESHVFHFLTIVLCVTVYQRHFFPSSLQFLFC